MLTVIINDAFCEAPHATIHSALKATINATHVNEVMGESQGLRVWDQAPSVVWEKVVTPPPQGRVIQERTTTNISPPWPPMEYRVFYGPRPIAKPVRTKTGKTVGYGLMVASQG